MKKKSSFKLFSDLRLYYVVALAVIFIWVPIQGFSNRSDNFYGTFLGYDWIWTTDEKYPIHYVFLGLEFIFITTIFILFKKKN